MKNVLLLCSLFCMPVFGMDKITILKEERDAMLGLLKVQTNRSIYAPSIPSQVCSSMTTSVSSSMSNPCTIFRAAQFATSFLMSAISSFTTPATPPEPKKPLSEVQLCEMALSIDTRNGFKLFSVEERNKWKSKYINALIKEDAEKRRLEEIEANKTQALNMVNNLSSRLLCILATDDDYFKNQYKDQFPKDYNQWFGHPIRRSKSMPELNGFHNH